MSRDDEFLFRMPGGKHLFSLGELVERMDEEIARRVQSDLAAIDTAMMDHIMVEVYDSKFFRTNDPTKATLGKISISSAIQKFQ